ncbi:AraC family transcriptional regulator [Kibdelosporangium philippinense]|uniref:AraC family transcriptional regulator n=1 Tax=Kibdelosporangium philippinense TaxID=211113 RepID=A0ABS8Z478_9PSEU|nr:AraC family transcriptional regulator [Kibdelosporangium philippinense]MCE7002282.1 AraC family transcriptional regulator [Kibdelosporangium philippinense]
MSDEQSAVARLRLSSQWDKGWQTPVVQLVENDSVVEHVDLPAIDELALVLVTKGQTTIESWHGSGWDRADYYPGRIRVTPPGKPTRLRWRGATPFLTTHVLLPNSLLEHTAADLLGSAAAQVVWQDALAIDDPVLAAVIDALGRSVEDGMDQLYADTAASYLATHLLTRHSTWPEPRRVKGEDMRIRKAISFIKGNYHLPLTVNDIAAVATLTHFHFLRLFKDATGETPHRYLNNVRLDHARRYLERGDLSMADIAKLCGFTSASRFATVFRRELGMSPSVYRQNTKKRLLSVGGAQL